MRSRFEDRGMTTWPLSSAHRSATAAGDTPRLSATATTAGAVNTGLVRCPFISHCVPSEEYASYCHPRAVQKTRTPRSAAKTSELRCTTAGCTVATRASSRNSPASKLLTPMARAFPAACSASSARQLSCHVPSGSLSHRLPQHRG